MCMVPDLTVMGHIIHLEVRGLRFNLYVVDRPSLRARDAGWYRQFVGGRCHSIIEPRATVTRKYEKMKDMWTILY